MEAVWHDADFIAKLKQKIEDGLKVSGKLIETSAKKEITTGANKAVDSGKLRDSINSEMVGTDEVRIGTNVEYATFVELGTANMPPRPFLRDGAAKVKSEIKEIFKKVLATT
jgi:HK97 gp10 family phage protein